MDDGGQTTEDGGQKNRGPVFALRASPGKRGRQKKKIRRSEGKKIRKLEVRNAEDRRQKTAERE
jgi:hypothetical protein